MRGAATPWTLLKVALWLLHLPPPAASTSSTSLTPHTPASSLFSLHAAPEGHEGQVVTAGHWGASPAVPSVQNVTAGFQDEEPLPTPNTTTTTEGDVDLDGNTTKTEVKLPPPLGGTEGRPDGGAREVTSPPLPSLPLPSTATTTSPSPPSPPSTAATTTTPASPSTAAHRHRHHHAAAPLWLKAHLDVLPATRRRSTSRRFEQDIAEVFRGVAFGGSASYRSVHVRRQGTREAQGLPRIERTTAVIEEPQHDYLSDGISVEDTARNESVTPSTAEPDAGAEAEVTGNEASPGQAAEAGTTTEQLEVPETSAETLDPHHNADPDTSARPAPDSPEKGDAASGVTSLWQVSEELVTNRTAVPVTTTRVPSTPKAPRRPAARLSWLDVLRCTHRGLAWVLVNFFLGFLLLILSLLGPYRLFTMRWCTPLLPRTHYVAVHLLVFVAASLKAVYLFHLAFGSRGRLPLVLLLLLTNTGFPCLSSAFLVLLMMMFVAADVRVYKSKLVTPHNTFVFLVVMLALGFIADVIVGCAHSRSVLLLSRVMVIAVAAAAVLVFVRKQQAVMAVSQMMKREFQGELKLLVVPAKDDSLHRHMGTKHILSHRLGLWCRAVRVCAACLALLSFVHLLHTVFLVSAYVPAWAWWLFHVSGCLTEAVLAVATCVAAALTQRYDENISFPLSFLLPPSLLPAKEAPAGPPVAATANNAEAMYQRVSFSSGTESTQYTACCPEGIMAGTPQAPRKRGAPVKRSATFSHVPHLPHSAVHLPGHANTPVQVARVSSTSNLPLYGILARGGVYGPGAEMYGPGYGPTGDASMLVHEDGFVRVRTPMDVREGPPPRPHGSLILLQQAHFRGSSPQLRGAAGAEGPPRHDNMYQSMSRRRKVSRGPDVLQNNIDVSGTDYQSSPSIRTSYGRHSNLPSPHTPGRDEADYYSLSRRRRSQRDHPRDSHMNNLDRPEEDYRSLTRRQVSREDNNDPVHQYYHNHDHYASRRSSRDAHASPLNVYEDQAVQCRPTTLAASPGLTHKVSNRSFSPSSPSSPLDGPVAYLPESPRCRRQARFPRPFMRAGSNRSLQGEDLYQDEYVPRAFGVRRNHSSAGYYPSRYLAPSTPSLLDEQRYGSLRLARTRKRQHPLYAFTPDGKLLNRHPEEWSRDGRTRTPEHPQGIHNGPGRGEMEDGVAAPPRDCPSRQSTSSKRSEGGDQDWATELITSSSILADFYSLTPDQKKAKRREREKERERKIMEEQEE
ncbi:hypothetical protein GWK47_003272 [Chionoecetes opilio]|uniref:Proline-rich transmembrane protein 3/4 domain-containing protein n=1 Tax=Chionoecetes opilio TaxID=41210 RepID=A0A8J5D5T8_CHIOP|nr:hypothetical protein GWK47_003272 [Chionoecetes opilio]